MSQQWTLIMCACISILTCTLSSSKSTLYILDVSENNPEY